VYECAELCDVQGWPHARFYAAVPLVNSDNVRLGTL
jgi:hypothetical protein